MPLLLVMWSLSLGATSSSFRVLPLLKWTSMPYFFPMFLDCFTQAFFIWNSYMGFCLCLDVSVVLPGFWCIYLQLHSSYCPVWVFACCEGLLYVCVFFFQQLVIGTDVFQLLYGNYISQLVVIPSATVAITSATKIMWHSICHNYYLKMDLFHKMWL